MARSGVAIDRALLPRLAQALTASLGLRDVLAAASQSAAELVPDSFVLVWLLQGERLVLKGAAGVVEGTCTGMRTEFGFGEGLPGEVARRREPLAVEDVATDPRTTQADFLRAEGVRWFIGVPLSARFALEGVLGVFVRGAEPPDPDTMDALGALAAQVALTVESARLVAHSERRRREAEALASVSQALAYSLDSSIVSQLIADSLIPLLNARDAAVYRLDRGTGALVAIAFGGLLADWDAAQILPHGV